MKILPEELMRQLISFAEENNLGAGQICIDHPYDITVILIGDKELAPHEVAILAAHMLLTGVISSNLNKANEKNKEEAFDKVRKPFDPTVN